MHLVLSTGLMSKINRICVSLNRAYYKFLILSKILIINNVQNMTYMLVNKFFDEKIKMAQT